MRFVFAGLALAACGGTAHQITIGPPPPKETHAVLAGPLCADNRCTCRDGSGDGGAGLPDDPSHKRYEIRLGPSPHDLWLTIAGGIVLYKSPERAEECFYIDLPTGQQPFELRASNPDGVSVALHIAELGAKTKSWYDTFEFKCGSPGVCSFDELDIQKSNYTAAHRNLFDQCGSTKVKGIAWDQGKAPDQQHPSDFVLRATLDIYKFDPWKPHGDTCGEGFGRKEPAADSGTPPAQ